jgi:protein-S-isoprenylcysteine O-methyltransferase Ste14
VRASDWEFKNRAMILGFILGGGFPLYMLDHLNSASALASWLGPMVRVNADLLTRLLFLLGALLMIKAAFLRTWASAYLKASVVYADKVKTEQLVADGPYRRLRNPLYYGNVLMALGLGSIMSRLGFVFAVTAMLVFTYRLIFREEADLEATQGESYRKYRAAVPRLWFSPLPQVPSAGSQAHWGKGFRAELWAWGFAAAVTAFAVTLNVTLFYVLLAVSVLSFWLTPSKSAT